jgi:cytochrome c2
MPVLLKSEQDRADVAAYLATLKSERPLAAGEPGNAAGGKALFDSIGCAACHEDTRHSLAGVGSKFTSAAALARYLAEPLMVDSSGRMPDFNLSRAEAADLAAHLMQARQPDFEKPAPAGNPARGRTLAATVGCANCHSISDTQGQMRAHVAAAPLAAANAERGCLADAPPARAPEFALGADDRAALRAFVQSPDVSPAPVQDFHRAVAALQCNACHELNGPARLRPEPAPPSLTDAGNKLRASWLEDVLLRHKRVRPWMALRMPRYGAAVAPLVNAFAAQAGAELGEGAAPPAPAKDQVEAGAKLIGSGEGGLSCINCHDFKGEPSPGQMRGPDLTEMNARIRTDWLRRWLREPARIQEGTAMPAFFSDMPAARADAMIGQIVHALAAGKDMPVPPGWGAALSSYVVTVTDTPVLIRTFLPECSPRGIAVGLPGGQSYCFDAAYGLLRYAWRGDFLDAKGAWSERGGQASTPLGQVWLKATLHPLRIGDPNAEHRIRFRGYQLDEGVPVFRYEINGTPVTEKTTATKDNRGLVREFTVTAPKADVTVLDPNTPGVVATTSVGEFVNGRLRVPAAPTVRFTLTLTPK